MFIKCNYKKVDTAPTFAARFSFQLVILLGAALQTAFAEPGSSWDYSYSDSSGAMGSGWNDPASSGADSWGSAGSMGSPADTSMWDYPTMTDYSMGWSDPASSGSGGMMDDPSAWGSSAAADYSLTADDWMSWNDPALADHSATADTSTPSAYATPSVNMAPPGYSTPSIYATPPKYPTSLVDPSQAPTPPSVYSTPPFYATPAPGPTKFPTAIIDPIQSPTPPKYATPSPSPTKYPTPIIDPGQWPTPWAEPPVVKTPMPTPTPAPTPSASPTPAATPMPPSNPTPTDYPPLYPPVGSPEPEPFEPLGFCGDGICKDFEFGSCPVDCGPQIEGPQSETPQVQTTSCPGQLEAAPPAECNLARADLIEPFDFHRQSDPASALWHSSELASGAPSPHGNEMVPLFQIDGAPLTIQHKFLLPPASYQYQRNSYLLETAVEVAQAAETRVELIWLDAQGLELERWSAGTDAFAGLHSYRENLIAPCNAQSALLLITATPAPDAPPALLRLNRARFEYPSCSAGDPDDDKLFGEYDNCPLRRNVDQRDRNTDGIGDACSQVALSVEELEAELAALPQFPEAGSEPQSQPGDGGSSGSESSGGSSSSNDPLDPATPLFPWELFPVQTEDDEIVGSCGMHNVCNHSDRCCLAVKSQLALEQLGESSWGPVQEATALECPWPAHRGKVFRLDIPPNRNRHEEYFNGSVLLVNIDTHRTHESFCIKRNNNRCIERMQVDPCLSINNEYALSFVRKDNDAVIFERPERDGGPYLRAVLQLASCEFLSASEGDAPRGAECAGELEVISNKYRLALRHRSATLTTTEAEMFRIYRHDAAGKPWDINAGEHWQITEPMPGIGYRSCNDFRIGAALYPSGIIPADLEQRKVRLVLDSVPKAVDGPRCELPPGENEFILSPQKVEIEVFDGLRLGVQALYRVESEPGALVELGIMEPRNRALSVNLRGLALRYLNPMIKFNWNARQTVVPSGILHDYLGKGSDRCDWVLQSIEWQ